MVKRLADVHEHALYPHIPQELICRPVVAQLGLLVNAHDDIHPNKCSHFLSSGGIPFDVWFVCLSLLCIQVGLHSKTIKERWLPKEAKETQCCGIWIRLIDWTRSLSEWSGVDRVKVA